MKKTYSTPRSTSVDLYAEEALLSVSGGTYDVDANQETEYRWSQEKDNIWGNSKGNLWSNMGD